MQCTDLGVMDFAQCLTLQEEAVQHVIAGGEEKLLLVEHPDVVTLGRNASTQNLLIAASILADRGIEVIPTSRGGDITCHFPGQLVAYPIFRISKKRGGIKGFFHKLEDVVIRVLDDLGIKGDRIAGKAGVFVNKQKIASMGIAVRRWVSYHGLSINLTRKLDLFTMMHPCGLKKLDQTSIHLLGQDDVTMNFLKQLTDDAFRKVFAFAPVA